LISRAGTAAGAFDSIIAMAAAADSLKPGSASPARAMICAFMRGSQKARIWSAVALAAASGPVAAKFLAIWLAI